MGTGRRTAGATPRRATLAGATALTTAVLPVFLVGALGPVIGEELGLGEAQIGAAATALFLCSAVVATAAGRVVERVGAGVALRAGVAVAGLVAAAIAIVAHDWWSLVVPMTLGGVAVALIDTGAARAFADRIPARRQGFAFGIKEASIPGASMLAGLSLPTVAAFLGWRASFLAAAGVTGLVLLALPAPRTLVADRPADDGPAGPTGRVATAGVVRFAIGVGLGTSAATATATFLVSSLVDDGISSPVAGTVLSIASLAGITARVASGRWADRDGVAPVPLLGTMQALGAVGLLGLVVGGPLAVVVPGAVVAIGAGWGWTGLAFLAVVRAHPTAPAAAAGVVLTGLGLGSALGPFAFGTLIDAASFEIAWAAGALAMLAGAVLTASARRELAPVGAVA